MLIQFTVENHRSIKNSAVISFAASKDKSFEEYLLHPDAKKTLLPALAIYGANAAGKSNVLHAMMTMKEMVVGNAAKASKGQKLPWEPFGGIKQPTTFEIVFIYQGIRYTYGFSFDAKKIYKEYLFHWPNGREALIFSREDGVFEFRENINEQMTLSNRTPDNKLYLVSSNDWNLPQTENAYRWFLEKLTFLMEEEPATSETVAQIASGDDKKARILKELLLADLGITDVALKNSSGKAPVITTTHRIINEDGTTEYFQLLMEQESAGTQHFFTRIGGWLQALENGDAGNFFSPTLIVAPLSGKRKKIPFPTHYPLENEHFLRFPSVVLLEQIRTIDKQRVYKYLGRLSGKQMAEIDEVICVSLEMTIPEVEEFP